MAAKHNKKGFTLIELLTVIAIIGILLTLLVPSIMNYVKKARAKAAIADTKVIKSVVESALMQRLMDFGEITNKAYDKRVYYDRAQPKEYEKVGAFTSYSWYQYRMGKLDDKGSQKVDTEICEKLEDSVSETWPTGSKGQNPLPYNTSSRNCEKYCEDCDTNIGLVVVYNKSGSVVFMQVYRKGILVSYVKGDYVVNMESSAHFVGVDKEGAYTHTWDKIYTEAGEEPPEGMENYFLGAYQIRSDNGAVADWGLR